MSHSIVFRPSSTRRVHSCRGRPPGSVPLLLLMLLMPAALFATGCATAPPLRQVESYDEAFRAARQVSEQVLLEVAADWHDAERIIEGNHATPNHNDDAWLAFDVTRDASDEWTIDAQIELRLRFWLIAQRYNDAMLALAERRPPEEVRGSVLRFAESISALPIQHISRLGGPLGALSGLIGEVIAIIDDHIAQQRFEEALKRGGPVVMKMIHLLQDDIEDFYDLRLVQYQRERRTINQTMQLELLPAFRNVYTTTGESEEKIALFDTMAAILVDDLGYRSDQVPNERDSHNAEAPYTTSDHSQLTMLLQEIRRLGESRRALDERMKRYQDLLASYHILLTETAEGLAALQRAVEDGDAAPPEELLFTALAVYRELIRYRRGGTP